MTTLSFMRLKAMIAKEYIQLFRDRGSVGLIVMVPLMQLLLFGYAIDTTPRHLNTLVLMGEHTPAARAVLGALTQTRYFDIKGEAANSEEADEALKSGRATFIIEIPPHFERDIRRGVTPSVLIAADASDPAATGVAVSAAQGALRRALDRLRLAGEAPPQPPLFDVRVHARYNPAGETALNVVPGLLAIILTLSTLVFTALSVTREQERGTMEALLVMPVSPVEIMLGKISPYVFVGFVQTAIVLSAGALLFGVPMAGSVMLLAVLATLFIACNLALGYLISTIAENQLQAMQFSFGVLLPSVLLSGFLFPFEGMPGWAQIFGEVLPVTHFIRIVRGILLKGADLSDLAGEALILTGIMLTLMTLAVRRFRKTLD